MSAPAAQPISDAQALAALHRQCFDKFWDEAAMADLLASPQRCALGFYEDGAPPQHLNGFICLQWAADEAEILTLAVAPSRRRQGLASQLIASAAEWLAARGVKQWHLEVAADNQPARALYRRLAFVEIGERKGYYAGVDAALMRRDL